MYKKISKLLAVLGAFILPLIACGTSDEIINGVTIPSDARLVRVVANSGVATWVQQAADAFNNQEIEAPNGDTIFVIVEEIEAGQAVVNLAATTNTAELPDLWIPDETVWVEALATQGQTRFSQDCQSIATSPLVIATWRPIAESLGWPSRNIGWLDIGSLAADPTAWAYYSGGQFGDALRLGHTHPGLSGSGASTLLALVQAAESQTEAISVQNIEQPIVQASVSTFEAAVSWFSPTTDALGHAMKTRGAQYLGAAIMYESTVQQHNDNDLIAIYPFEGTFVATHPACLHRGAVAQYEAQLFRDYLLSPDGQTQARTAGLRPVDAAALSQMNSVDLSQPERIFAPPSVETLYAVQELWQAARKPINLVMLLDTSGSMRGDKIQNMQTAARRFVEQMGDKDKISIISFNDNPYLVVDAITIGKSRPEVDTAIANLNANGNTALFDAVAEGSRQLYRTHNPSHSNVMVVLSDGQDTASTFYTFLTPQMTQPATIVDTTIFTIGYGDNADTQTMSALAQQGNGNYYIGDEASIALIYEEMSAAFGGSVGIGR